MEQLSATLIDVGWGDSIFLERIDESGQSHFGLIDSNDKAEEKSSYIFIRKHLEKRHIDWKKQPHVFDFVLLSHAHLDHGKGLKFLMNKFGAKQFWYPKSLGWGSLTDLLRYANNSSQVQHHQSVDESKLLPAWGGVKMEILWPLYNSIDQNDENNNSVVLVLRLGQTAFVLSGDAEESVWKQIAGNIPDDTVFFKVPHHGSVNGTFGAAGETPWLDACPQAASLGISAHLRPFAHPHQQVVDLFEQRQRPYFRTDHHYHVTFLTDGTDLRVQYSHV